MEREVRHEAVDIGCSPGEQTPIDELESDGGSPRHKQVVDLPRGLWHEGFDQDPAGWRQAGTVYRIRSGATDNDMDSGHGKAKTGTGSASEVFTMRYCEVCGASGMTIEVRELWIDGMYFGTFCPRCEERRRGCFPLPAYTVGGITPGLAATCITLRVRHRGWPTPKRPRTSPIIKRKPARAGWNRS